MAWRCAGGGHWLPPGNLPGRSGIQSARMGAVKSIRKSMTFWHKRDWQQYYEIARRPWQRLRPPRPVYPTGLNRVQPAAGFSLSELDDAAVAAAKDGARSRNNRKSTRPNSSHANISYSV